MLTFINGSPYIKKNYQEIEKKIASDNKKEIWNVLSEKIFVIISI
jgi:hypothetical protein